jgi:4-diphosphocytidyl-2-C-methyl-D-erythritol kinase
LSETTIDVRCPAKVNWSLWILDRRADGYHEIETVLQAIDLFDDLRVCPGPDMTLECDDPAIPTDGSNLVLQAADALRQAAGGSLTGARFVLRKRIPVGGGLGGGSSDAAGALVALNALWGLGLDPGGLAEVGARVGSDVPFFLHGGTALGTGRGERIAPLEFAGNVPILLGLPPFGISTAEVYDRVRRRLTLPRNDVSVSRLSRLKVPGGKDFGAAPNDLEEVVFEGWPELSEFRDALLDAGAESAKLSGSGSTVFGAFERRAAAREAARTLRASFETWGLVETRAIEDAVHLARES